MPAAHDEAAKGMITRSVSLGYPVCVQNHLSNSGLSVGFERVDVIGDGEELRCTLREQILFGLVILLDGEVIAFPSHCQNNVWRNVFWYPVTAKVPLQHDRVNGNLLVLFERRARGQFVIRGVTFPFDWRVFVFQESLQEILEDAFAGAAVRHDHQACFLRLEAAA
jgi:hypothetical protein